MFSTHTTHKKTDVYIKLKTFLLENMNETPIPLVELRRKPTFVNFLTRCAHDEDRI